MAENWKISGAQLKSMRRFWLAYLWAKYNHGTLTGVGECTITEKELFAPWVRKDLKKHGIARPGIFVIRKSEKGDLIVTLAHSWRLRMRKKRRGDLDSDRK